MDKKGKFNEFHMLFNADARPEGKHPGRYNSPALSEVGIIFNDEHPDVVHHDVVVYFRDKPEYRRDGKEDATQTFDSENAFYDSLQKIRTISLFLSMFPDNWIIFQTCYDCYYVYYIIAYT